MQAFLNATQDYPLLLGQKANLYKCFLPQAWYAGCPRGVSGFLHPEGIYDDPKGGLMRVAAYGRLRYHFQFHNELRLFADVHHDVAPFGVAIYGASRRDRTQFSHLSNGFSVATVDGSFDHDGHGTVPGIKTDEGAWNTAGHRDRVIQVDEETLALFARLYDEPRTPPLQVRPGATPRGVRRGPKQSLIGGISS